MSTKNEFSQQGGANRLQEMVTVTTVGAVTMVGAGPGKVTDTLRWPGGRVDCPNGFREDLGLGVSVWSGPGK